METGGLITVFGGTGFLGRRVVRRAREAGWTVRVAARHPRPDLFADDDDQPEQVEANVRDPETVAAAVRGAAGVVNAVGLYAENRSESFHATHVIGAAQVAHAAQRESARLVHLSGIGVDRRSPSAYIRARALGEERIREACPDGVILRPSALFGPGDALLSTMSPMIRWLPVIPLFGDGGMRIQPVHVDDVARAAVTALERSDTNGGTYELGGPDVYSYREFVEALAHAAGRRRWLAPVPFGMWNAAAAMASLLPGAPLTRDQVELMRHDNVIGSDKTFADLGIEPSTLTRVVDAFE